MNKIGFLTFIILFKPDFSLVFILLLTIKIDL